MDRCRIGLLSVIVALWPVLPLHAQGVSDDGARAPEMEALFRALYFRGHEVGDVVLLDVCGLQDILPVGLDINRLNAARSVRPSVSNLEDCSGPVAPYLVAGSRNVMHVDSISVGAEGGGVWLTVNKGEDVMEEHHFVAPMFQAEDAPWRHDSVVVTPRAIAARPAGVGSATVQGTPRAPSEMNAILEVLHFRAVRQQDATPVDVCSMRRVLPPGTELPRALGRYLGPTLTAPGFGDCGSPAEVELSALREAVVSVDSLALGDRQGSVWLRTKRGNRVVREHFYLDAVGNETAPTWITNSVTIRTAYSSIRRAGAGSAPACIEAYPRAMPQPGTDSCLNRPGIPGGSTL